MSARTTGSENGITSSACRHDDDRHVYGHEKEHVRNADPLEPNAPKMAPKRFKITYDRPQTAEEGTRPPKMGQGWPKGSGCMLGGLRQTVLTSTSHAWTAPPSSSQADEICKENGP